MFRSSSANKKRQRKIYFVKTILKKSFEKKHKSYRQLQKVFYQINLLIHYNSTCIIYININAFKRRDFNVVIYYLKFEANFNNLKHEKIEFILFLNRILIFVEKRY